jgi:hypothetical protein
MLSVYAPPHTRVPRRQCAVCPLSPD